ncbi:hypothetical protein N7451_012240 [Penicillium sp. IBT 35674x]|nr:hypothetical protein N7451_012240 [Penicillium sp. IBT 35674x]
MDQRMSTGTIIWNPWLPKSHQRIYTILMKLAYKSARAKPRRSSLVIAHVHRVFLQVA